MILIDYKEDRVVVNSSPLFIVANNQTLTLLDKVEKKKVFRFKKKKKYLDIYFYMYYGY